MRFRPLLPALALLSLAACTDRPDLTAPGGPAATRRIVAPSGTLDQNITALIDLLPRGLATAGRNRWGNVKAKYQEGLTDPAQMKVARKMLFELAEWVKAKGPQMSPPPNNETVSAATARLTLYMSQYVYDGPETAPPVFLAGADNAIALVTPEDSATVVTPAEQAGVAFEEGTVSQETIIVITENPTPYPANCSGPLATRLCQYPRFYHFSQFPHEKLLKPARFAVCHVNDGGNREPLADHDRFRLAHEKPANPADYTPGSTIRDQNGESVEILPEITQTFSICEDVVYALNPPTGMKGALTRLAKHVGKLVTPKNAYAIDQGGGGLSIMFSDFNNLDPDGVPDDSVDNFTTSADTAHGGDEVVVSYTVRNTGTATALPTMSTIAFNAVAPMPASTMIMASVPVPAIVPGDSVMLSAPVIIPGSAVTGGNYTLSVDVGSDPTFPDTNTVNNVASRPLAIDPAFISEASRYNVNESSACALTSSNQTWCWGNNLNWQYGQSGPAQSSPFQPTALAPYSFVEISKGHGQFFCGIKADRSATCWGRNGFGQLGRGIQGTGQSAPAPVLGGISWASISPGRLHTCGVSTSGVGYCWGSNQSGENGRISKPLGTDTASMTFTPAAVDGGLTFKSVLAGWLHSCGLTTSGAAYCWGDNRYGQIGIGIADTAKVRVPTPVLGGLQFVQLTIGTIHTCGITATHQAYCWGQNGTNQLGDGTATNRSVPTLVAGGHRFSFISTSTGFGDGAGVTLPPAVQGGIAHTCALKEDGAAWCWGWNGAGQLGDGTTVSQATPVAVSGGLRFTSLRIGGAESCGRRGNRIWCWGGNQFGQIGNGTLVNTTAPVLVASPFNTP
ncbi:MAG TPA: CARDB domain-containing protein [Gemmatimonadaceae bacterium]|nr:CARDB domain-containing protein [Gemmatimonadaceae bacterium]